MPATGDYTFGDYQREALSFSRQGLTQADYRENALYGLGEVGEVIGQLKKEIFHDHPRDPDKIADEVGDILWYVALACRSFEVDADEFFDKHASMPPEVRYSTVEHARSFGERRFFRSVMATVFREAANAFEEGDYLLYMQEIKDDPDQRVIAPNRVAEKVDSQIASVMASLGAMINALTEFLVVLNIDWETVMAKNVEKLSARYSGGFTTEKSLNRVNG